MSWEINHSITAPFNDEELLVNGLTVIHQINPVLSSFIAPHTHAGQSINPDNVILNKSYTDAEAATLSVGAIFYNSDQLCWMIKTSSNTYLNLGEELPMICKNGDSSTHLEGVAVYIVSGSGNLPVLQFTNSTIGKCSALATQDVLNTGNARGYYCFFGQVRTFPYSNVKKSTDNQATWIEGAALYLCNENGKYSTTKEAAPAKSTKIGTIITRSGGNISVLFHPDTSLSIEELSNVDGTTTSNTDTDVFLKKESDGLWKSLSWTSIKSYLKTYFDGIYSSRILCYSWVISDMSTDITTGSKITDDWGFGFTITEIYAKLKVAAVGALFTIDIKKNGVSIFSTKLTFDSTGLTTRTATTPYVLVSSPLVWTSGDTMEILVDVVGVATKGQGCVVKFLGYNS